MFNLTKKEDFSEETKRELHMLHYDGEKRFTVTFPYVSAGDMTMQDFDEYDEALAAIGIHYRDLINDNNSMKTVYSNDDRYDAKYSIFDNLTREDEFAINLSDMNMFALIQQILSVAKPKAATIKKKKEAEENK